MVLRVILAVLLGGLLAFQVVRGAVVRQSPIGNPLWPGHGQALLDATMAEIGTVAARGKTLPPHLRARAQEVARKMPLAPEPFLIEGAVAQMDGRSRSAERLFLEAKARNPRSTAARYFLAERFLLTGRVEPALVEMATLSRLTGGAAAFGPGLAAYARKPGAVAKLRPFLRSAPEFEPVILSQLAGDARNLDLILALWSGAVSTPQISQAGWQAQIVERLIAKGDFRKAQATWRRLARVSSAEPGLFNPRFREIDAPPPFNWTFGSAGGLAQPAGEDQLEVIYFGRDVAVLAEQLLLLEPGRYQLGMQVQGDLKAAGGVAWSMECLPSKASVLALPIPARAPAGGLQASFTIPANCPAQRFQLAGSPGEFTNAVRFTVGKLQLRRAPGA